MIGQDKINLIAYVLVLAGAINWLGVGTMKVDYVASFLGENAKYIYVTVGLAGLYLTVIYLMQLKKQWEQSKASESE
jgi:uncharacterized membrane protein YuzA (DUF378 family)